MTGLVAGAEVILERSVWEALSEDIIIWYVKLWAV